MRFENQVAVITGGGGGLGRALAHRFAREGARVVVADIDVEAARQTVGEVSEAGGQAIATHTDITFKPDVRAMLEAALTAFGNVDILVNNAKISSDESLHRLDEAGWAMNVDVILKGAFLCTQAVLPGMMERGAGVIVNIGSVNAFGYYGNEAYSAAKAGLVSLTKSVAVRHGRDGVRCNMVAPGSMYSPVWARREQRNPGVMERVTRWYPLGRVGTPEDVSNAVLFLTSDEASWITGAVLPVDGGLMAGNLLMAEEIMRNND